MGINSNGKEILLAVFIGGSVVLSGSAAMAECNETQTDYDELVSVSNNVASALIQTQIEYQAATINFAIEKAGFIAEKERAWDRFFEEMELAKEREDMKLVAGSKKDHAGLPMIYPGVGWTWDFRINLRNRSRGSSIPAAIYMEGSTSCLT